MSPLMTTDQNIADRLEERPAVIKGEGFNPSGGGFARIIVDGVAYTPEQVRSALQSQAAEIEREKRSSDMWAAEVKAAHARIAELENERDEALAANRGLVRLNEAVEARALVAEARLKDAVKVIENFLFADKDGPGLLDCIDRSGKRYPSQFLADTISEARAFISTTGGDSHG